MRHKPARNHCVHDGIQRSETLVIGTTKLRRLSTHHNSLLRNRRTLSTSRGVAMRASRGTTEPNEHVAAAVLAMGDIGYVRVRS